MNIRKICILLLFSVYHSLFTYAQSPKYEMRGAWVATVINIDWPSKKGLSTEEQKAEFIRIADMHKRNGMNALFVQIRPAADAFYPSQYEPWSEYLTGVQGQAPAPYYDPLKFMIDETHKRGMEFHAWINPYRAVFDIRSSSIAASHITRAQPEWFVTYGKNKIFNPGLPQVMNFVVKVIRDIIGRYDIDGLHMDDYFYPYPEHGEFNDYAAWQQYGKGMDRADWRRSNCDSIVKRIHEAVVQLKPMISFGVSPFGIWRNQRQDPDGSITNGTSSYDAIYCNTLLWLKNGWIDYVAPQIYWRIGNTNADYKTLVDWWAKHTYGKNLYIGHAIYRASDEPERGWIGNTNELPNQIKLLRQQKTVQGSIYFSSKSFFSNPNGWNDSLRNHYYANPALVPPMWWIDNTLPAAPEIWANRQGDNMIRFNGACEDPANTEIVKSYVLYFSDDPGELGKNPVTINVAQGTTFSFDIPDGRIPAYWNKLYVAATSVDRENNESPMSNIIRFVKTGNGQWMANAGTP